MTEADILGSAVRDFEMRFSEIKHTDGPHKDLVMVGCGGVYPEGMNPPAAAFSFADAVKLWLYGANEYAEKIWGETYERMRPSKPPRTPRKIYAISWTLLWRVKPEVDSVEFYQRMELMGDGETWPSTWAAKTTRLRLWKCYSRFAIIDPHWKAFDIPAPSGAPLPNVEQNDALIRAIDKL